jgi:hypothetical protein
MPSGKSPASKLLWYLIPLQVLLVTFLLTLLSFAVSLLLGILGIVIAAHLQGLHPNMTLAYRYVALPVAATVGVITLISASVIEIRDFKSNR